jgi:hypothetical protein
MGRKLKIRLLIFFILLLCVYIFYHSRKFSLPCRRCKATKSIGAPPLIQDLRSPRVLVSKS